jgi:hypothetical protein
MYPMSENCSRCGNPFVASEHTPGYGILDGQKVCYPCCGELDAIRLRNMNPGDRTTLYLDEKNGHPSAVTNWPGTLTIPADSYAYGHHNIAGKRIDVWFAFEGRLFWGVNYGDNTQIVHVKRLKGA